MHRLQTKSLCLAFDLIFLETSGRDNSPILASAKFEKCCFSKFFGKNRGGRKESFVLQLLIAEVFLPT